jgi:hypothetical protein
MTALIANRFGPSSNSPVAVSIKRLLLPRRQTSAAEAALILLLLWHDRGRALPSRTFLRVDRKSKSPALAARARTTDSSCLAALARRNDKDLGEEQV